MRNAILIQLLICVVGPGTATANEPCAYGAGPRAAVMGYLTAMHQHRFEDAYDFVSANMTDGRPREEWAALQARAYQPGKVSIYGVDPRTPRAADDDDACAGHAMVPNILSSRDKLNEQGLVEFEVYSVRLDGEDWRVDGQETLFEDADIARWFPEVTLFRGKPAE